MTEMFVYMISKRGKTLKESDEPSEHHTGSSGIFFSFTANDYDCEGNLYIMYSVLMPLVVVE